MKIGAQILLLIKPDGKKEAWSGISEICRMHDELPYAVLRLWNRKSFPNEHVDGNGETWRVERLLYREKV